MTSPTLTHVDPQTLRAFAAVAREGNVSRAAQRLHLSQPAVSLQLKALAEATGLQLFTRTPQGMALTHDGAALLPLADKALAALADFGQAAAGLHNTVRGTLRIGTILDPEFTRLGAFLKQLVESSPQVGTELRQGMSGDVLAQIDRGDLDVGFFLNLPDDPAGPAYRLRALTRFTYRVLAPAGWGPQVIGKDWKALAALPWLATPPASAHHRLQRRVFGPGSLTGVEPHRVALVDQEASMLDLVKSGVGLSLVRDSIAMREAQARGLVIADQVELACDLSFVCLSARAGEPVIEAAWAALGAVWDQGMVGRATT
ncbi:LysR family transcriptional regulator [Hydrogenophaga sp. PBL-H3]|uniref:LysR family transcriptional regulator n=1 Tax=Hydrogenophaga sp. PBL-H3 TaxID=434010 RepID=UPI00131FFB9E|nr:LysR family transcriptional regulator [Hydrogenophaga sp. PBL-H3]QHE74754.1 LysR family transcriptional regulator [Hydrogenophaga sp. PBL-H3]QHE79180.1 LysR family transcriptional regulator [Hydrogenophaga sp. PBL-H3]